MGGDGEKAVRNHLFADGGGLIVDCRSAFVVVRAGVSGRGEGPVGWREDWR